MNISDALYYVWGRNSTVGTSLEELYAYDQAMDWASILATAAAVDVSSSSTNDTAAGTGARTIRVFGIDANFNLCYEDITMNGQTKVDGAVAFLRVFGAEVLTVGSLRVNNGDIHIVKDGTGGSYTGGVPGTLTSAICKILTGWGSSMNGLFVTPAGSSYKIKQVRASTRAQAGTVILQVRDLSVATGPLKTLMAIELGIGGQSQDFPDIVVPAKHEILLRVLCVSGGIVSAEMYLERVV